MPVVPQPNASGIVRTLGFNFDFAEAFTSACLEQGVESVEAYATLAATVTTQFTANGVGAVGTSSDIQAPNTSLWALSKEATADALTAASNASVALQSANIAISTADDAKETADANLATLNTQFTANGVGAVGISTDIDAPNTSLWALSKQAYSDAQTAATNANAAFENAATAQTSANTAQTSADTAQTSADTAQTSADTALTNALKAVSYNLTGAAINATITNRGTGAGNAFPQAQFTLATTITFNVPPDWSATDSVYLDGWVLYNFQLATSLNAYWGVRYTTPTMPTPPTYVDILGSTTVVADALTFTNTNQIYLPVNLIIPPTYLTSGGTITLSFYGYVTTSNHYFSVAPVVGGRVGLALD